ncbi:hypothetical protein H0H92_010857 [Tricholoma furcatifolium]|nr:hypothetical protein H0H92_010857 [Tricholoma furcatifolium]
MCRYWFKLHLVQSSGPPRRSPSCSPTPATPSLLTPPHSTSQGEHLNDCDPVGERGPGKIDTSNELASDQLSQPIIDDMGNANDSGGSSCDPEELNDPRMFKEELAITQPDEDDTDVGEEVDCNTKGPDEPVIFNDELPITQTVVRNFHFDEDEVNGPPCSAEEPQVDDPEILNEEAVEKDTNANKEKVDGSPWVVSERGVPEISSVDPSWDDATEAGVPSDDQPTFRQMQAYHPPEDSFDHTAATEHNTDVQNRDTPVFGDSLAPSEDSLDNTASVPSPLTMQHWSTYANPAADLSIPFCKFHSQGQCNQGNACRFRHSLAPNEFALLFHDAQPPLLDFNLQLSVPPTSRHVCKFYALGKCQNGDICPYLHLPSAALLANHLQGGPYLHDFRTVPASLDGGGWNGRGQIRQWDGTESRLNCKYFLEGNCQYGDKCKYRHDAQTQDVMSSNLSDPTQHTEGKRQVDERSGEAERSRPCKWYPMGKCHRGDQCRFLHDSLKTGTTDVDDHSNGWGDSGDAEGGVATHVEEPAASGWADDDGWGSNAPGWGSYVKEWATGGSTNAKDTELDDKGYQGNENSHKDDSWHQDDDDGWGKKRQRDENSRDDQDDDGWGKKHQGDANDHRDGDGHNDDGWGWASPTKYDPWAVPKKPCSFYARGKCKEGSRCNFAHESPGNDIKAATSQKGTSPTTRLFEDGQKYLVLTDELFVSEPETSSAPSKCQENEVDGALPVSPPLTPLNDESKVSNEDNEQTWSAEWPQPAPEPMPPAKIEAPCKAFGQGYCPKGDSCQFQHIVLDAEAEIDRQSPSTEALGRTENEDEKEDEGSAAGIAAQTEEDSNELVVEHVFFHCTVRFGLDNGCSPIHIVTASDTRYAVISNLPPDITIDGAVELIQTVDDMAILEDVRLENHEAKTDIIARFAASEHADGVVTKLHAQTYDSRPLAAWKTREPPQPSLETIQPPLECRAVKITWAAPSRSVWFYYTSITTAKKHEERLNSGLIVDGRKIKAEFSRPRRTDQHFAVNVSGFHVLTDDDEFARLATDSTLRHKNGPSYIGCPLNAIQNTLAARGTLEQFFSLPMDPKSTQHTAFARFKDGLDAVLGIHNSPQAYLGNGSLALQKVFHANYKISDRRFQPVSKLIEQLAERAEQNKITLDVYDLKQPVDIHLYAKASSDTCSTFGSINRELDDILQGTIMMVEGDTSVPVWDEYFAMPSSERAIEKINNDTSFFIKVDMRRQVVRMLGDEEGRKRAQIKINTLLKMVRAQRHSVLLDLYSIRTLVNGDYARLQDELGAQKVILDLVVPELILLGDAEYDKFKARTSLLGGTRAGSFAEVDAVECCFICKRFPREPIKLVCMHSYCTVCLRYVLLAAAGTRFVPPRCLAGCDEYIPYTVVRDVLPMAEEASLLRNAFLAHVRVRKDEFFFCPLPHCETVFRRLSEGRTSSVCYICPACESKLCAVCGREYHEGIDCTVVTDA